MEKYYYPAVKAEFRNGGIALYTVLRVGARGRWFNWVFEKKFSAAVFTPDEMIKFINGFHEEVYLVKMIGKMDLATTDAFGELVLKESELQINESSRLKLKYSTHEG